MTKSYISSPKIIFPSLNTTIVYFDRYPFLINVSFKICGMLLLLCSVFILFFFVFDKRFPFYFWHILCWNCSNVCSFLAIFAIFICLCYCKWHVCSFNTDDWLGIDQTIEIYHYINIVQKRNSHSDLDMGPSLKFIIQAIPISRRGT